MTQTQSNDIIAL